MLLDNEIVAGLLVNKVLTWYVSERGPWIMDHEKWLRNFQTAGFNLDARAQNHDDRFGIPVINYASLPAFVDGMSPFQVTKELLSSTLLAQQAPVAWEEADPFFPSLLLDFDTSTFLSMEREDYPFEKYVADGWASRYGNFLPLVADNDRYWVVSGIDYFAGFYN